MQWLSPSWLLAALAVAIPIVYHLRRQTPPEVVRVGSVANLATGAALANRRLPRDWLLLCVRCTLILLVAVILAGPHLASARSGRRLVVSPSGNWSVVDSLTARGAVALATTPSRYPWSSALAAASEASPNDTLLLVSPDDAERWIGPRPGLRQVTIAVPTPGTDAQRPGPPAHQLATSLRSDREPLRHRALSGLLWWLALGLAPIERVLARRSPDAG